MHHKKSVDPIPESFDNLEEAGEFWDSHDTIDYPEAFTDVENVTAELQGRYYEVEIEKGVAEALRDKARQEGVSVRELATEMLRRQLKAA